MIVSQYQMRIDRQPCRVTLPREELEVRSITFASLSTRVSLSCQVTGQCNVLHLS